MRMTRHIPIYFEKQIVKPERGDIEGYLDIGGDRGP